MAHWLFAQPYYEPDIDLLLESIFEGDRECIERLKKDYKITVDWACWEALNPYSCIGPNTPWNLILKFFKKRILILNKPCFDIICARSSWDIITTAHKQCSFEIDQATLTTTFLLGSLQRAQDLIRETSVMPNMQQLTFSRLDHTCGLENLHWLVTHYPYFKPRLEQVYHPSDPYETLLTWQNEPLDLIEWVLQTFPCDQQFTNLTHTILRKEMHQEGWGDWLIKQFTRFSPSDSVYIPWYHIHKPKGRLKKLSLWPENRDRHFPFTPSNNDCTR